MPANIRVLLVTTWDVACGVSEHSFYLKQAVEAADPTITIEPDACALDPTHLLRDRQFSNEIVHLNYQASLHARWTSDRIEELREKGIKTIVTFHDTGVPNSDHAKAICAAADAFVVHEPYDDLGGNGRYWRMGVPDPANSTVFAKRDRPSARSAWLPLVAEGAFFKAWTDQPVLGSIGFPFPWKNFDLLAEITARLGWALLLIAPTATPAQVAHWTALNPDSYIRTDFVPRGEALSLLTGCDATAFPYVCCNTGQSGAILQGIATRKPVLAFTSEICRQFRALALDGLGNEAIRWADSATTLKRRLATVPIVRCSSPVVALAEQESWRGLGQKYAELYRSLV